MASTNSFLTASLFALALSTHSLTAVPAFTVGGFVDEEIYRGNGLITLRFDAAGRLWATEKQGRLLVFPPNDGNTDPFQYDYYETATAWSVLPNFDALTPVASGTVSSFTLTPRLRDDNFGFRFTGQITVPTAGLYTFYLASDDGSRLLIDGAIVVNHDGTHGSTEKSGTVNLTAGSHTIRVDYFEAGGGQSLLVQMEGPGQPKAPITKGPFKNPLVFANFTSQVNADGERGLLGLALDPDFAANRYLYVLYSTASDQRISRLTADATFTAMVPDSETILLSGLPNANNVHKAGDIAFHPNDPQNLYIMLGDDGNRGLVADLNLYNGKILKISAADGRGLPTNPYYDNNDATTVRSRVWSHRYRNPFRFTFDPAAPIADVLYISENGDGTDRSARIAKGADGGWDNAFLTDSPDGKRKILTTSGPSRVGVTILRGGAFAADGPVFYNARINTSNGQGELSRWRLTGANLDQLTPLPEDNGGIFYSGYTGYIMATLQPGPDGALYYSDSGQGPSAGGNNRLGRLRFVGGTAPVANFNATPLSGQAPLNVTFTDTSSAPGSTLSTWSWTFGDGGISNLQNPAHTFTQPGVYQVTLTVTNALGLSHSRQATVTATHQTSITLSGQILDASLNAASALAVATELRFYQFDGSTPLPIAGGGGPAGNALAVAPGGVINAIVSAALTGPGMVVSAGDPAADGVQAAYVGASLSTVAANQSATLDFRLSDTLLRGRVTDTKGAPARVDLGLSRGAAGVWYGFSGGRDFLPGSPFGSSGVGHRLVPDALGYYHIPIRSGDGGGLFFLDTSADTLSASHGRVKRSVALGAGQGVVQNLTIGLYDGGIGETDLSGLAPTANVTLVSHIQSIFNVSCQACHNDIATNSGGLDLQSGAAFAALVNHESAEAPGVKLVEPGSPTRSYLMEKINAATPQVGTSMRPGDPMVLSQRALIRDWIQQLDAAGRLQFSSGNFATVEGSAPGVATITVERTLGSTGAISVTISTIAGGTAVAGSDYSSSSVVLNWSSGDLAPKTADIPILPDSLAEGTKSVLLQLSAPTGGAFLGPLSEATLAIADRPFDAWRLLHFGAQANAPQAQLAADFDGDGLSNLAEYALGLNPTVSSPAPVVGLNGAGHLQLSFARNTGAVADLNFTVEASDDLQTGNWQMIARKDGAAAWTTNGGASVSDNAGAVIVTDGSTASGLPGRWLRLRVEFR